MARHLGGLSPVSAAHGLIRNGNVNGAVLASFLLKGTVPILHGSAGCALHYRHLQRQGYLVPEELICTDLNEADVVRGGAEKLRSVILDTNKRLSPQRILVIPTDPVLAITDDVPTVLSDLSGEIGCDLLYADIKTISQPYWRWHPHRFLHMTDEEAKYEEDREKSVDEHERQGFGCGYADAYRRLIERYMKPLPRDEKLLVIGGFPVPRATTSFLDGVAAELGEFGLKTLFLNRPVDVETFALAPAAAYALGFHWNCEFTLKRLFGVEPLSEHIEASLMDGPDGLEEYYLRIIELFALGKGAKEKIVSKKQQMFRTIHDEGASLYGMSCALCVNHPNMIWWTVRLVRSILEVDVKYILLTTQDKTMLSSIFTEDNIATMIRRALANLKEITDDIPHLLVNPASEQINKVADEVDFFLGRDCFPALHDIRRGVTELPEIQSCFDDYLDYLKGYVARIQGNDRHPQRLLKDRLSDLENKNTLASRQMSLRISN